MCIVSCVCIRLFIFFFFFFQAEDGIRDLTVTGVQTCALPIYRRYRQPPGVHQNVDSRWKNSPAASLPEASRRNRSEEHTSELQSQSNLVCRLLLEKKTIPPIWYRIKHSSSVTASAATCAYSTHS